MPLTGLAADVEIGQVRALLLNRSPDLLDPDTSETEYDLFVNAANGIATEVAAIVGEPPAGNLRTAAVWAVTLGTAHLIEAALFPEQQLGEFARAEVLRRRYEAVLVQLRVQDASTGVVPPPGPLGWFPPAPRYPDPIAPTYPRHDPRPGWHG